MCLDDDCHAVFVHLSNRRMLSADLVHMVKIVGNCIWYVMEIEEEELDEER